MWGRGPRAQLLIANRHGREGSAGIQGSGTPLASLPQEPVCLKEDLEGLAKLELGAGYGSWAQYPPWVAIFTGLIQQVPWSSVEGLRFVLGSISTLITVLFLLAERVGGGRGSCARFIEGA